MQESLPSSDIPKEERTWAMFAHLSPLLTFVGLPGIANIIIPLVMWQLKKDVMPFGSQQAKECLNFQLSLLLYYIIAGILVLAVIGIPLLIILGITNVIFAIIAGVKANNGQSYRYPLSIRFIS